MKKFIINDINPHKDFSIDYLSDSFISIKRNLNASNIEKDIKKFTIEELEEILYKLKEYLDNDLYRKKDFIIIKKMYDYILSIRYWKKL